MEPQKEHEKNNKDADELDNASDNELMAATSRGSRRAFEILVLRHRSRAVAWCRHFVRDDWAAEDIVQECFADVYMWRDRYKMDYAFTTYLYMLIRCRSVDYLRKYGRVNPVAMDEQDGIGCADERYADSPEAAAIRREQIKDLSHILDALKPEYRQILYLMAIRELSYNEIADYTGYSVAKVKVLIHRARKKALKLKKQAEEREGDLK